MKSVQVKDQQTVFDIAVQEYGSIEGVFDLLDGNDNLELDSDIVSGTMLKTGTVIDQSIVGYYTKNNIVPATQFEDIAGSQYQD